MKLGLLENQVPRPVLPAEFIQMMPAFIASRRLLRGLYSSPRLSDGEVPSPGPSQGNAWAHAYDFHLVVNHPVDGGFNSVWGVGVGDVSRSVRCDVEYPLVRLGVPCWLLCEPQSGRVVWFVLPLSSKQR